MRELLVSLFLLLSAYRDWKEYRIANKLILTGWSLGCVYNLWSGGWYSLGNGILSAFVLILMGWPLYRIGGIGAGDIKLCSVIAVFHGLYFSGKVLMIMSVIAGVIALFRLWKNAELKQRCTALIVYILDRQYRYQKYYDVSRNERGRVIPLAPITWISYCLALCLGICN